MLLRNSKKSPRPTKSCPTPRSAKSTISMASSSYSELVTHHHLVLKCRKAFKGFQETCLEALEECQAGQGLSTLAPTVEVADSTLQTRTTYLQTSLDRAALAVLAKMM